MYFKGGYGLANRACLFFEELDDAMWDVPITRDCGPEQPLNLANFTVTITKLFINVYANNYISNLYMRTMYETMWDRNTR